MSELALGTVQMERSISSGAASYRRLAAQVFERDQGICWLCGRATNASKTWPHPLAPTLDHVRPRSLGGLANAANCRCAHYFCNTLRGAGGKRWERIRSHITRLLSVGLDMAEGDWGDERIERRALRQAVLIGLGYALRNTARD